MNNQRAAFARLSRMVEDQERRRTENVEKASRELDPVTREEIMEAARADAKCVLAEARRYAAGMLELAVKRVGRELRQSRMPSLARMRDSAMAPIARFDFDEERHLAAREHFDELLAELDRLVLRLRANTGKAGSN